MSIAAAGIASEKACTTEHGLHFDSGGSIAQSAAWVAWIGKMLLHFLVSEVLHHKIDTWTLE